MQKSENYIEYTKGKTIYYNNCYCQLLLLLPQSGLQARKMIALADRNTKAFTQAFTSQQHRQFSIGERLIIS